MAGHLLVHASPTVAHSSKLVAIQHDIGFHFLNLETSLACAATGCLFLQSLFGAYATPSG